MSSEQMGTEANEADLIEQSVEVEPVEGQESSGDAPELVDEADWIEQQTAAPLDDERQNS